MPPQKHLPRIRKILIALNLATESGREIAAGIFAYARAHCHWQIEFLPIVPGVTTGCEIVRRSEDGFDGIIHYPLDNLEPKIPSVAIGYSGKSVGGRRTFVRIDDEEIGAAAVRYLTGLGSFSTYAYMPEPTDSYYSRLREQGFVRELESKGLIKRYRRVQTEDMATCLKTWTKPMAIFACADALAVKVLETCRAVGINVPRQAVILGVDDDKLLCDFAEPPLTSLRPDHGRVGYLAAEQLDKMLDRRPGRCKSTKVSGVSVSERESTRPPTPSGPLINRALRYIRYHLRQAISAEEVAAHLGVSRRLVDLRFREQTGETLSKAILRLRLEEVASRLGSSTAPIKAIAAACGFTNINHLANTFRRRFNQSMTAFRKSVISRAGDQRVYVTDAST